MSSHECRKCHKPLTDPMSVALGIGPDCRMKAKQKELNQGNIFANQVQFDWDVVGDVISIIDRSQESGGRTVTNGVEEVIENLVAYGIDLEGKRIIYRDTQGVFDEICIKKGKDGKFRFSMFKPLTVKSFWDAIEKVNGAGVKKNDIY